MAKANVGSLLVFDPATMGVEGPLPADAVVGIITERGELFPFLFFFFFFFLSEEMGGAGETEKESLGRRDGWVRFRCPHPCPPPPLAPAYDGLGV